MTKRRASPVTVAAAVLASAFLALLAYGVLIQQPKRGIDAALAAGDTTPAQIVERVYIDVDRVLWPPARESVRAQLTYLAERGEVPPGVSW